jgi:hypothetical protein
MPTFFEDEPIAGTLALSLDKEDSITAISVSVSTHSPAIEYH